MMKTVLLTAALTLPFLTSAASNVTFRLGAMFDVSRGRVLRTDLLKTRFEQLKKMGYAQVMLYTEDIFRLPDEPKWSYMRGGYTLEDVRSLKAHADKAGLSLIPCVQTLGHLGKSLRWSDYADIRNTSEVLLIGEAESYALIDKILDFWEKGVGGTRIHIGMDEAFGFAGGRCAKRHPDRQPLDIFLMHLVRVNELCAKHGFTEPIIWSDMFYRIASETHDYYDPEARADESLAARIPPNVRLCLWDYYHGERSTYEGMIDGHRTLGSEPILAGGIQLWQHFIGDREKTLGTTKAFLDAARAKGVTEFFFTLWGDDGGYAIPDLALEGLFACAELAAGRTAEPTEENCARFREITGLDYRSLAKLGEVNRHYADQWPEMVLEASILYDDPLYCGNYRNYLVRKPSAQKLQDARIYRAVYRDAAWRDDGEKVMADYRQTLADCSDLPGVPRVATELVRTLAKKVAYEADILAAWKAKDRAALERIAQTDLPALIAQMQLFDELYRADWYATSRPFGFETMQKRNAAVLVRLNEARRRLSDYLAGAAVTIEELDEAMQPFGAYNARCVIPW